MTDVLAVGAHPDDLELTMGGTAIVLVEKGLDVHFVDLTAGEPARHAPPGEREEQAARAAEILGVTRSQLDLQDRLLRDTVEARLRLARMIRDHRPSFVFTTHGGGVHPDHGAVTDLVVGAVFYARLPKWERVPGGEMLEGTEPYEIDRLFLGHCRMEEPWDRFDFAVDVTRHYDRKLEAVAVYESVFGTDRDGLIEKYGAEDRYTGSLVDVPYAEPFRARRRLLVEDPTVFRPVRYG
ncbi:MAG: PIG-L family deacetylase [Gemmatimonadota bacterium]